MGTIQTSPLVRGTAAALASAPRSASSSYPRVPIDLSSSLPVALGLAEEPPKGLSFGAKSKNSFLLDLTFLPPTQHSRRNRPGRATTARLPPSLQGGDRTVGTGGPGEDTQERTLGTGHWGQEAPTQTPKAGREAATGDQGQKKTWAVLNPKSATEQNTQFPNSLPSQGAIPGTVPHVLAGAPPPPPSLRLQRGAAGRSCRILFFMKRLRKRHRPREKRRVRTQAWGWRGGARRKASERTGRGCVCFQKPFSLLS